MSARVPCGVVGCRRSMANETAVKRYGHVPAEIICPFHWQRLTRSERRIWARYHRQARKAGEWLRPDEADRIWSALKRRAAQ